MRRQIVFTEKELDVLINRAVFAGYCLCKNKGPNIVGDEWKKECTKEREWLKSQTVVGG